MKKINSLKVFFLAALFVRKRICHLDNFGIEAKTYAVDEILCSFFAIFAECYHAYVLLGYVVL